MTLQLTDITMFPNFSYFFIFSKVIQFSQFLTFQREAPPAGNRNSVFRKTQNYPDQKGHHMQRFHLPPATDPQVIFKQRVVTFPAAPAGYRVLVRHLSTPEQILNWAHHLAGKQWATPQLLAELIEGATARHGIKIFN